MVTKLWRAITGALLGSVLALAAFTAQATISFGGSGTADINVASTDAVPTLPAGAASGDLMIITSFISGDAAGETDTTPSGWTLLETATNNGSGESIELKIFCKVHDGSEVDPTLVATTGINTGDTHGARVFYWTGTVGFDCANIVAHTAEQSNTAATDLAHPARTVTTANTLILAFGAKRACESCVWNTLATGGFGWNERWDTNGTAGDDWSVVEDSYTQTTATNIPSGSWTAASGDESQISVAIILSLKESAGGSPVFTVNPTVSSQTTGSWTIGGTTGASVEVDCVSCKLNSGNPTVGNVDAGNCSGGVAAEAHTSDTWAGADTLVLGSSEPFPIYDLYCTDGTSRVDLLDEVLDVPSGKQRLTLTSVDATSPYTGHGVATSDICTIDTVTDPDAYVVTDSTDGTVSYAAGGDESRQLVDSQCYDVSSPANLDFIIAFNNLPPLGEAFPNTLDYERNNAITTLHLDDQVTDPEGDTVTVTASDPLPTGLSISASDLTGTPTECEVVDVSFRFEDQYEGIYHETAQFLIGDIVPDVSGLPLQDALDILEALCQ